MADFSGGQVGYTSAGYVAPSYSEGFWDRYTTPNHVDPNNGTAASRLGSITKAQWADYQTRFVPIENQLMNMTTYNNKDLAGQEIGQARTDTSKSYDNIAGSQAIQLGRYGMGMNADQQQSSDRLNALGKSGAVVDAANNIRLKLVERNQQIASGSANPNMVTQG